ncbi:hypothetical protein C8Q79DRAFT_199248 [Trametes meyenii]|nr:hypothetical protein C8Q79DRAFT_199248 [Trametes meyenii]
MPRAASRGNCDSSPGGGLDEGSSGKDVEARQPPQGGPTSRWARAGFNGMQGYEDITLHHGTFVLHGTIVLAASHGTHNDSTVSRLRPVLVFAHARGRVRRCHTPVRERLYRLHPLRSRGYAW